MKYELTTSLIHIAVTVHVHLLERLHDNRTICGCYFCVRLCIDTSKFWVQNRIAVKVFIQTENSVISMLPLCDLCTIHKKIFDSHHFWVEYGWQSICCFLECSEWTFIGISSWLSSANYQSDRNAIRSISNWQCNHLWNFVSVLRSYVWGIMVFITFWDSTNM